MRLHAITILSTLLFSIAARADEIDLVDKRGRSLSVEVVSITDEDAKVRRVSDESEFVIKLESLSEASVEKLKAIKAEKEQVKVTSLIVKKVDGKFRYFFDIRNYTDKPFEGAVELVLHNKMEGVTNGSESFATKQPIQSGLGTVVFFDAFTGPSSVHGDASVVAFSYTVTIDGAAVFSGAARISDKLEDLNQ